MKLSPVIFALSFLHIWEPVSLQAGTQFGIPEYPQERRHLGFVLAQGPSGEPQAALSEYTKAQGLLDGEIAAGFKGTKWWWLSGYISGFSIIGLVVQSEYFADRSDASLSKEEYQAIRGKGIDYIEGFRYGYQEHIRERREASNVDGAFCGLSTVIGVLTVSAVLIIVD